MTRRLILIRHAKAEAHGGDDAGRVLAARGVRDATSIGHWLAGLDITPDAVLVSPARRARQTWALATIELGATVEVEIDDRIYDNTVEDLLAVVHDQPADTSTVVLVGHNPSMHGLALSLDDRHGDATLPADFPTSAVAVFEIAGGWPELAAGGGRLVAADAPRG